MAVTTTTYGPALNGGPGLGDVTTTEILDGTLLSGDLADLAVTTAKINDLAVTTGKINDSAVTVGKMANLAARSILGRSANSTGAVAAIAGTGANKLLVDNGTTLAFASLPPVFNNSLTSGTTFTLGSDQSNGAVHVITTDSGDIVKSSTTGWTAGNWFFLYNAAATTIVITHNNGTPGAGNADYWIVNKEASYTLPVNGMVIVMYDGTYFRVCLFAVA